MVRPAKYEDLPAILALYAAARDFMRRTGNPNQWVIPFSEELLKEDIDTARLFAVERGEKVVGVFYFHIGEDPTYGYIEGAWKDLSPYGTIHRITGAEEEKGIFKEAFDFCRSRISHVRIDTHHDNKIMQHTVEKYGFERCGIIYLPDGDPRIAYEYKE